VTDTVSVPLPGLLRVNMLSQLRHKACNNARIVGRALSAIGVHTVYGRSMQVHTVHTGLVHASGVHALTGRKACLALVLSRLSSNTLASYAPVGCTPTLTYTLVSTPATAPGYWVARGGHPTCHGLCTHVDNVDPGLGNVNACTCSTCVSHVATVSIDNNALQAALLPLLPSTSLY
jgi:hypothetical protein